MSKEDPTYAQLFNASEIIQKEIETTNKGGAPTLFYDSITGQPNFQLSLDDPTDNSSEEAEVTIYNGFMQDNRPITVVEFPDRSRSFFIDHEKASLRCRN